MRPDNNIKLFNLAFFLMGLFFILLISSMNMSPEEAALLYFEMSNISSTYIDLIIIVDPMSMIFIMLVSFIATSVMTYAQDYMSSDPNKTRLSGLISLFLLSMFLLVLTPNIITLLLGWDGLGVISFALVLFYNNHSSASAAMITALTNRVGDILIIFSIGLWSKTGQWDMSSMENMSSEKVYLILLIAACTKSAQFPFSAWLPQAMSAPTPVSALVHSSTLVTAGVYLMIRLSIKFPPCSSWLALIATLSTTTSLMAGICALTETDLKKIVALSTLSQLGTMVLALSLGAPLLSFFHLVTHALSKSLLFVCVGSFISFNKGGQDTRNLKSRLWQSTPMSFTGATLASFSLCGLPFTSGFYSKDLILETLWQGPESIMPMVGGAMSTALTSAYSIKLLKILSEGEPSNESSSPRPRNVTEPNLIKVPIFFLSVATLFTGFLLSKTWYCLYSPLLLSPIHKYLSSCMLTLGLFLAMAENNRLVGEINTPLFHHFLHSMFFLEKLSSQGTMNLTESPLYLSFKSLEKGWIESITVSAAKSLLKTLTGLDHRLAASPSLKYTSLTLLVLILMTYCLNNSPVI
uniref:NADH dehydrogenase subunit 5 n=1 Tax=Lottia goshimai TaxID=1824450 RepID=UPI002113BC90|nr:NADH dehydrogenase subunit 5 [Lottia goshimai]UTM92219.1 NADH dehydrogenase subunit 5 [Lottia peitaihoensis]